MHTLKALLFDLGDTIMMEETEVKSEDGVTIRAELLPGMAMLLQGLKAKGFKLGLVADTRIGTYQNILRLHNLYKLFDVFAISEELGCEKPDPRIFSYALDVLGATPCEAAMCGNNLERDIAGANRMGITSIWLHWNYRYPTVPCTPAEKPDYVVHSAAELSDLVDRLMLQEGLSPCKYLHHNAMGTQ